MPIPENILANADDLGLNTAVNMAILHCYEQGYINSSSLMTTMDGFEEAVSLVHTHRIMQGIGLHVNFAEGRPLTNVPAKEYLDEEGNWDIAKTNRKLALLSHDTAIVFKKELCAQVDKALAAQVKLTHLDSHYHLHTLPAFRGMFLAAAKRYGLKIRLAQTYREHSTIKFIYRMLINKQIRNQGLHYSENFETVDYFLKKSRGITGKLTEIMLHPSLDEQGKLTDHYDPDTMTEWIQFLNSETGK